jgi:hypothetical protein
MVNKKIYKDKLCNQCNKIFVPNGSMQKFCSDDCHKIHANYLKRIQYHIKRKDPKKNIELLEASRKYYAKTKIKVFEAYGGMKCACCGESNSKFLTIDHIDQNGAKHRKEIGKGTRLYVWLRSNNFPSGFQVLCYNCNCGRYHNKGICPHKEVIHAS